jgi:uncharacterized protein YPO0396
LIELIFFQVASKSDGRTIIVGRVSDKSAARKQASDRQWHKAVGDTRFFLAEEVDRAITALRLLAGKL